MNQMQQSAAEVAETDSGGQPGLAELLAVLLRHWKKLLAATMLGLVLGVALVVTATPRYRSEVAFMLVTDGGSVSGLAKLAGNLGGLASLAGVSLGGGNKDEALELLRSRAFTSRFIERHGLMPQLFPGDWDAAKGRWLEEDLSEQPTMARAVERFNQQVREISEDKRTGIVRLRILWPDRETAADLANTMVAEADAELRNRTIADAQRTISFLEAEIAKTSLIETRVMLNRLLEDQFNTVSLGRTRQYFAFRVIDPATPADADRPEKPRKAMILVFVTIGGFLACLGWIAAAGLLRAAFRKA